MAKHFHPKVTLFAGPDADERAIRHREYYGPGSVLVLNPGTDPAHLLWPVWDKIVKIDWPGADWVRMKQLERALRRDGAAVVAGCDRSGKLILVPVQAVEHPKLKTVCAVLRCHIEARSGRAA